MRSSIPCGSTGKEYACNVKDLASIPGLGKFPGEGKRYPLQYSDIENSTDYTVHEVTKSRAQLSDFHFQVFLPGKSHGQKSLVAIVHGITKSQTRLSMQMHNNNGMFEHRLEGNERMR